MEWVGRKDKIQNWKRTDLMAVLAEEQKWVVEGSKKGYLVVGGWAGGRVAR